MLKYVENKKFLVKSRVSEMANIPLNQDNGLVNASASFFITKSSIQSENQNLVKKT